MKAPDKSIFHDTIVIGLMFWLPLLLVFGWVAYWLFFSPDYERF